MGSVGLGNNANLGAFLNRIFPEGLDLGRCQITEALGTFVADPANTFRAGMLVMRNAAGLVIPSDGTDMLGVAKWNHATSMLAAAVDEPVVLTGVIASNLQHALVSNVRVASAVAGGGTVFIDATDYTLNATNGTLTRIALGAIISGSTVYVTYTFQLSASDISQTQGANFWNNLDEVSQADGRVTVITDAAMIFTSQYDTSANFSMTGALSNLFASTAVGKAGLFTSSPAGGAKFVGRVLQVPTAADPFLGLRLVKQVVQF